MEESLNESAWRRGWRDTKTQLTNWLFVVVNAIISIALFLFGLFVLAWYWGVGLAVFPFLVVWAYETLSAPRKQRNEARKQVTSIISEEKAKLKGKFFHDFDEEGYVRHQGQITDFVNNDIAIVRYFDWAMGEPSQTKMVWLRDIVDGGWALYPSDEAMRDAYEGGHVRRRGR
jgi:membrane protein implicated in regulation of membrane protease activity